MIRTSNQSAAIWALIKKLGIDEETRKDLVCQVTQGRSESSKDLSEQEAKSLIDHLNRLVKGSQEPKRELTPLQESEAKMRGKVIHYLLLMGYGIPSVHGKTVPNWERINPFIRSIGSNNPKRKTLNQLSYDELCKVVTQVESMYAHEMKRSIKGRGK